MYCVSPLLPCQALTVGLTISPPPSDPVLHPLASWLVLFSQPAIVLAPSVPSAVKDRMKLNELALQTGFEPSPPPT